VEGTMLVAGVVAYLSATRATGRAGSVGFFAMAGLCLLLWATQPWSPPPPSATAVAWGTLILWILPPWSRWIDRNRLDAGEREDAPRL